MKKARIVIADNDINYVIPLQQKFVEYYFNKVNLEIISDKDYYRNVFSEPQTIDVVIVSESLFDQSLNRHNIGKIIVLSESADAESNSNYDVCTLYKYNSAKDIFNRITREIARVVDINSEKQENTKAIMVYAAGGGMGKTTISMGLAENLASNYYKVLYINASYLNTFQGYLDNNSPILEPTLYSKITSDEDPYACLKSCFRKEAFTYLPPFKAALISLGLKFDIYEKIVLSAKESNEYDYIIVDVDSGYNESVANLMGKSDKVFLITKQDSKSILSTDILASNISGSNSDKFVYICNNFDVNDCNAIGDLSHRFAITEYVAHIDGLCKKSIKEYSDIAEIKKLSLLIN